MLSHKEITNILLKEINENPNDVKFDNFEFNDLTISYVKITTIQNYIDLTFFINDYSYNSATNEFVFKSVMNVRFFKENLKKNIKEAVKFLLNIRENYKYSRITDFIIKNDQIEKEEKKEIAFHQICKNKQFDKCCVCYEYNSILTKCNHNLCRICHAKLEVLHDDIICCYKKCPMCRVRL
jgi:uncharacterized protein YeeX (DUF496 family)